MSSMTVKGVTLDGNIKLSVPRDLDIDFIFQCKHGFWWGKKKKIETIDLNSVEEWSPNKISLHIRSPELKVLRTILAEDWLTRVYEVSEIEIFKSDKTVFITMCYKN
jgi:hypothetical protein